MEGRVGGIKRERERDSTYKREKECVGGHLVVPELPIC